MTERKNRMISVLIALGLLAAIAGCSAAPSAQSTGATVSAASAQDEEITENAASAPSEEMTESAASVQEEEMTENTVSAPNESAEQDEEEPLEGAPLEDDTDENAITQEQYSSFHATVKKKKGKAKGFRDFDETLNSDFLGTWYDPEMGEAIRLTEDAAYVYIPYLDLYGDVPCTWELIDRSERGKCPELDIYCFGADSGPLAYYVAGNTGKYFWCVSQGQIFYKQK